MEFSLLIQQTFPRVMLVRPPLVALHVRPGFFRYAYFHTFLWHTFDHTVSVCSAEVAQNSCVWGITLCRVSVKERRERCPETA